MVTVVVAFADEPAAITGDANIPSGFPSNVTTRVATPSMLPVFLTAAVTDIDSPGAAVVLLTDTLVTLKTAFGT
jgi:hypothetical protein